MDSRKIEQVINTCWASDGKNFTARCWTNKDKLVNELNTILTQSIIRGDAPQKAIQQLSQRMQVSKSNAGRLILTETAAISSMSQKDCFKELDVEEFEFVATLDSRTSDLCRSMDGKHFKMSDYQIGLNAPPLHCRCRSCTAPYFNDEFSIGKRAARGEDGKTYYVPSDMTYSDWEKSFVDGGDKSGLRKHIVNAPESDIIKTEMTKEVVGVHSVGKINKDIYKCITEDIVTDEVIITDERIQHIKDRHPNDYERFCAYIPEIVQNPDYIIKANKPNTATVLKEINDNGEKFQLILRVLTSTDKPEFKNSVITFLKINERTWNKYLRNKEILYKKE